jgi:hypothetical protein
MSDAPPPPEQPTHAPEGAADAPKRSYHPPQVRELGHLADITATGPEGEALDGPPGSGYAS